MLLLLQPITELVHVRFTFKAANCRKRLRFSRNSSPHSRPPPFANNPYKSARFRSGAVATMVARRRVDDFYQTSAEAVEIIRRDIGEEEDKVRHVEELLGQWFRCQKHLPDVYDKAMARNFIRGSKFNIEIVKRKLEGYFLAKHAFPCFYKRRDPSSKEITRAFETVNVVRMPKLTDKGERICVVSLADSEPQNFDLEAVLKLFWMLYDLNLTCESPVTAEIFVFDCQGITPNHLVYLFSTPFKNCVSLLRDAYASRISQLHVVNCPPMVEKLTAVLRPLFHEKVRKRFMVDKGVESLHRYLPLELLPSDVGGSLGCLRSYMKEWRDLVLENSEWFEEQDGVNIIGTPPKRIDKFTKSIDLEGSFRQLNID